MSGGRLRWDDISRVECLVVSAMERRHLSSSSVLRVSLFLGLLNPAIHHTHRIKVSLFVLFGACLAISFCLLDPNFVA